MLVLARTHQAVPLRPSTARARSVGLDRGPRIQLDPRGREPVARVDRRRTRAIPVAGLAAELRAHRCGDRTTLGRAVRSVPLARRDDRRAHQALHDRHLPPAVRRRGAAGAGGEVDRESARRDGFWPRFPVPTVPTDVPEFREEAYWKGPTWINMNWMVIEALTNYGERVVADELTHRTLDLVDRAGCFEYFSPLTGTRLRRVGVLLDRGSRARPARVAFGKRPVTVTT